MLKALQQTNVVRCDQAAWRLAGISFAGWNVVASLLIVWLSIRATSEALNAR
jgi:disulfide bond formation protein DsbB